MAKLSKESKIRVLENYYALDYAFFGKPIQEVKVCCPFFAEEYIAAKGALLSALVEMYKLTNHSPKVVNEQLKTKDIKKRAIQTAKIARENAENLIKTKAGKNDIKKALQESISTSTNKKVNIEKTVHEHVKKKAFSLAIDSMLIGRSVQESKNFEALNTFEGEILEEAYKTLRDNLSESALVVLENLSGK